MRRLWVMQTALALVSLSVAGTLPANGQERSFVPAPVPAPCNLRLNGEVWWDQVPLAWDPPADTREVDAYWLFRCVGRGCAPRFYSEYPGTTATPIPTPGDLNVYQVFAVNRTRPRSAGSNVLEVPVPGEPRLFPLAPPDGAIVGLRVVFRWRVENMLPGTTYYVRLDKGVNACDSWIEERFDAGMNLCLAVNLSPSRYSGYRVSYAIQATGPHTVICQRAGEFTVNPAVPATDNCQTADSVSPSVSSGQAVSSALPRFSQSAPCPPTAVEPSTWSNVKQLFR